MAFAPPTAPDDQDTLQYAVSTQVFEAGLADAGLATGPLEPPAEPKPVLRRARCKSRENFLALPAMETPSPKPANLQIDVTPQKSFPTRDDQLNMKAKKAEDKDNKQTAAKQKAPQHPPAWSAEDEVQMWDDYYAWREELFAEGNCGAQAECLDCFLQCMCMWLLCSC